MMILFSFPTECHGPRAQGSGVRVESSFLFKGRGNILLLVFLFLFFTTCFRWIVAVFVAN